MARNPMAIARAGALIDTHGGPALVYQAPLGTTFPTGIGDVIDLTPGASQYLHKSPWTPLGLTKNGVNVSRGFTDVKRNADQTMGDYDSRPVAWNTMISTELLKTDPTTLQLAWVGGAITQTALVKTSVGIAAAAGATSLTVMSAAGLTALDLISVGNGPDQELVSITAIAGNVLTVSALLYAHASGALAFKHISRSIPFGTARVLPRKLLSVLCLPNYEDPSAGGAAEGLRMFCFRGVKLEPAQRQIQHSNSADWTLPVSFQAFPDLAIADPDLDTMVIYELAYN